LPGFAADSFALYQMLVPDAAAPAVAGAKSLIVVPSGSLYRLAFETLVTKDPASVAQPHYLLEDVPISYIPSASLLAVVRSSYAQPTPGRRPLLAFANPTFGDVPPGEGRGVVTYADLQLDAVRAVIGNKTASSGVAKAVFPALPGTQTEADAVRTALSAPSDSLIVGDQATRERVLDLNKTERLKAYEYLLFATHAVLPSEIRGLTQPAIVLAHPERGDGLLTMADVFGLSLDADLVTLSACNTGVPTAESSGEGISGLTRAFLYAGSPAISVTLWEVDDEAAPQITPAFFAGMHAGKLTPAESLRRAKLTMLESPDARFRHPYAWGPSVIFGDGDRAASP
jgi:CHAT domain-containing protein